MYVAKRGVVKSYLVVFLLIVLTLTLFALDGGITGAVIGLQVENTSLPPLVPNTNKVNVTLPELVTNSSELIEDDLVELTLPELDNLPKEPKAVAPVAHQDETELEAVVQNKPRLLQSELKTQASCSSWPCNCGDSITGSITMTSSLSCPNDGLDIGAANVVVDCAGFVIEHDGTAGNYEGIENTGAYDGATIKNCNISGFYRGIHGNDGNSWVIENNTIFNISEIAIDSGLSFVSNYNISNNTIFDVTNSYAIELIQDGAGLTRTSLIDTNTIYNIFSADPLYFVTATIRDNVFYNLSGPVDVMNSIFRNNTVYLSTGYGVDVSATGISTVENNTIHTNIGGITIGTGAAGGTNISDNLIYNNSNPGIRLAGNSFEIKNNTIYNNSKGIEITTDATLNNITVNLILNNSEYGIDVSGDANNIFNNIFTSNSFGSDNSEIYLQSGATSNNISNNTLTKGELNSTTGIEMRDANNIVFNILSDFTQGIKIINTVGANISFNNITNSDYALNFTGSNSSSVDNNELRIQNVSVFLDDSYSNTFTTDLYENFTVTAINVSSGDNNIFSDLTITNLTNGIIDIFNAGTNTTLRNSSAINKSSIFVANGNVIMDWFVDVNIKNTVSTNLINANVTAYNFTESKVESKLTSANGNTQFILTEFTKTSSATIYHTNHTINATLSNQINSTNINLTSTNSTAVNLVLNVDPVNCGYLNNDTTLLYNLESNGTCFIVNASHITIDGGGATIVGNTSGIGINLTNVGNITIKDLTIQNFNYSLFFDNTSLSNVTGTFLDNNSYGILLGNKSQNNTIYTNYIRNNTVWGIEILNQSGNNTIYDNYMNNTNQSFDNSTNRWNTTESCVTGSAQNIIGGDCFAGNFWTDYTGADDDFDELGDTPQNISGGSNKDFLPLVEAVTVACGTITSATTYPPNKNLTTTGTCFILNGGNYTFDGNGLTLTGDGDNGDYGILLNSSNITIINFNISNFEQGINIPGTETDPIGNYTIYNNTFPGNLLYGIYMDPGGEGNISDNIINVTSSGAEGIYLNGIDDTTFYGNTIDSVGSAVSISGSFRGGNNIFTNNVLNSSNNLDLTAKKGTGTNFVDPYNYFINTTFQNETSIVSEANSFVYVQHNVIVNVSNSTGDPISDVNVSGFDVLGNLDNSKITSANGIALLPLSEYFKEGGIKYFVTNNHTIKAVKGNYSENSTLFSVKNTTTSDRFVNLTLSPVVCGMNVTSTIHLGENLNTTGTCFTVTTSSITIDGGGFNITGSKSGSGVSITGKKGITVSDLTLTNFTYGLYLEDSNDSSFSTITIINNSYGVYFNQSNNNSLRHSVTENNTITGVYSNDSFNTNNSLVNTTIDFENNVTVNDTSQIFRKWVITVNVSSNQSTQIQSANASGFFNSSNLLEDFGLTGSDGVALLELSESVKNDTGIIYLTPHNISASLVSSTQDALNSTTLNLTLTNNTLVNLTLALDCTVPTVGLLIDTDTTLCPGTYNLGSIFTGAIDINSSDLTLTCDGTVLVGDENSRGIRLRAQNNVTINGCNLQDYDRNIDIYNTTNSSILSVNVSGGQYGIYSSESTTLNISFNTIASNTFGLYLIDNSKNHTIFNNSFTSNTDALVFVSSFFNDVYHNNFSSSSNSHLTASSSSNNNYNTTVTISGSSAGQGNTYDDYCDKGVDNNADSYADALSSAGANDWPYNSTSSTLVVGNPVDYAPFFQDCVTEVQLTSPSSSSASSSSGGGGGGGGGGSAGVSAAAAVVSAQASSSSAGTYSAQDAAKFLEIQVKGVKENEVVIEVENTGDKDIVGNKGVNDNPEESVYVVTTKSLSNEGSFASNLMGIALDSNPPSGNPLKVQLEDEGKQVIIKPGEKKEIIYKFTEPLTTMPRTTKFGLKGNGDLIKENEIQIKGNSKIGSAIDHLPSNKAVDLYLVVPPVGSSVNVPTNGITGAVVGVGNKDSDDYTYEVSINKDGRTKFVDLYGPYKVKKGDAFIFAQKFQYDQKFVGPHTIRARLTKSGEVVSDEEFEVNFAGAAIGITKISSFWLLPIVLFALALILWVERKRKKHLLNVK